MTGSEERRAKRDLMVTQIKRCLVSIDVLHELLGVEFFPLRVTLSVTKWHLEHALNTLESLL